MVTRAMGRLLASGVGSLLFAVVALTVLLWALFPEEVAQRAVARFLANHSPGMTWRVGAVHLRLTEGVLLEGIEGVGVAEGAPLLLRAESLTVRPDWAALLTAGRCQLAYRLRLAEGDVQGILRVVESGRRLDVRGAAHGLHLAKIPLLSHWLGRDLAGSADVTFTSGYDPWTGRAVEMTARVQLDKGRIGLKRPLLAHTWLPLARATAHVHGRGKQWRLEQGMVESELFTAWFAGTIDWGQALGRGALDIAGTIQPRPALFKGIDNMPALQAVRVQLERQPLTFRISGDPASPGLHFEDDSMLFQTLEKELQ